MNWEKFESAVSANIPVSQFLISHELRKLTIQAELRFKNPNFQSFCELEKIGSTAWVQGSNAPILNL